MTKRTTKNDTFDLEDRDGGEDTAAVTLPSREGSKKKKRTKKLKHRCEKLGVVIIPDCEDCFHHVEEYELNLNESFNTNQTFILDETCAHDSFNTAQTFLLDDEYLSDITDEDEPLEMFSQSRWLANEERSKQNLSKLKGKSFCDHEKINVVTTFFLDDEYYLSDITEDDFVKSTRKSKKLRKKSKDKKKKEKKRPKLDKEFGDRYSKCFREKSTTDSNIFHLAKTRLLSP